jgi:hypothetical protein
VVADAIIVAAYNMPDALSCNALSDASVPRCFRTALSERAAFHLLAVLFQLKGQSVASKP